MQASSECSAWLLWLATLQLPCVAALASHTAPALRGCYFALLRVTACTTLTWQPLMTHGAIRAPLQTLACA